MKKVVLNNCYGGFSLSEKACKFLGLKLSDYLASRLYSRDDPKLVECIEVLGEEANGLCADLVIVEYDDRNYTYDIDNNDGLESLVLVPIVHMSKIIGKTVGQVAEYLGSLGIHTDY